MCFTDRENVYIPETIQDLTDVASSQFCGLHFGVIISRLRVSIEWILRLWDSDRSRLL